MAGNFQATPRAKNALDNRKLNLGTKNAQGKYASLLWSVISNNPRITVYTNDPNDQNKNYGKISANLDLPVFYEFIELLRDASVAAPGWQNKIQNKNFIFPGGKRSENPVVVSELHVGKDKDGIVWISVTDFDKERPRIKFPLRHGDFHAFFHADGTQFTDAEMSVLTARGYVNMLSQMVAIVAVNTYVEPEKKENSGAGGSGQQGGYNRGGGGGAGGGNRGGGSGGGAPANETLVEEDLPF